MRRFKSISPHDGSILGVVNVSDTAHVQEKVAREAQRAWRSLGVEGRVAHMRRFLEIFTLRKDQFALLATREMGAPLEASKHSTEKALGYLKWYVDNAARYLTPEITAETNGETHTVYREPYGVAAVIVPWNFPASNFAWGCGQNLLAGNTVVFKSSEEVPLTSQLIESMMVEAGMPKNVWSAVYGRGPVGALLSRQEVDLICFTGSTEVGMSLYRTAAARMIKINLELGGSAPGIVFEDADLEVAIPSIYERRFRNAGQVCDALKRLIVHESIWDPVVEKLVDKLRYVQLGDPTQQQYDMGPLVSQKQLEVLERQVDDAVKKGALVMTGGKRPGQLGFYYEPTLLSQVTGDMRVWREETFGPVLPLMRFSTEEEAVRLANDTRYGLGASIYTRDTARAERVASALESGMVSVNGVSIGRPENPFGGYKESGLGRENGHWGFEEVTQVKIVSRRK